MTAASSLPPSSRAAGPRTTIAGAGVTDAAAQARKDRAGSTRYTTGTGEMPRRRPEQLRAILETGRTEAEQIAAQ